MSRKRGTTHADDTFFQHKQANVFRGYSNRFSAMAYVVRQSIETIIFDNDTIRKTAAWQVAFFKTYNRTADAGVDVTADKALCCCYELSKSDFFTYSDNRFRRSADMHRKRQIDILGRFHFYNRKSVR